MHFYDVLSRVLSLTLPFWVVPAGKIISNISDKMRSALLLLLLLTSYKTVRHHFSWPTRQQASYHTSCTDTRSKPPMFLSLLHLRTYHAAMSWWSLWITNRFSTCHIYLHVDTRVPALALSLSLSVSKYLQILQVYWPRLFLCWRNECQSAWRLQHAEQKTLQEEHYEGTVPSLHVAVYYSCDHRQLYRRLQLCRRHALCVGSWLPAFRGRLPVLSPMAKQRGTDGLSQNGINQLLTYAA